ncbi:MAG: carboxypeptidase regulatory-like domain-containing protein, partial [Planctomycetes bacterium]|nr:carboxypeptidase regulatory-like domain-containing protein [Planctomycetota bacterium]
AAPLPASAIRGLVLLPDGRPAAGATVTILRAATAWPDWRSERVDQAITGPAGTFEFRVGSRDSLLVEFSHPAYAGGLEAVPTFEVPLQLALQPGFELFGVVTNPAGAVVPNARVAIEAVPGDDRRAQAAIASASGGYRFTNLRAGPVRLVARHESWQPAAVPVVVVGDQVRRDLIFERPSMAPLRGRVTSALSQEPVAGAAIELLPANVRPGLADPVAGQSAADGAFLLAGLARGTMRLVVRHPEHGVVTRTLAIGAAATEIAVELPPRSQVEGQLVSEQSPAPFRGGEVLQIRDVAGQLEHAVVAADGRFRFANTLSPGRGVVRLQGGELAFQASFQDEVDVRIEESSRTELELVVLRARSVRGRVVDEAGRPLAGARIARTRLLAESARFIGTAVIDRDLGSLGSQVVQLFRDDRDELLAVTDAEGRFTVAGRNPGSLLVRIGAAGHGTRWLVLEIPSGPEPGAAGDLVLGRASRIQGRVVRGGRGLAGATVTASGAESQAVAMTRADGGFVFADLVPGTYRLRARLPSQPSGSRERVVATSIGRPAEDVVLLLETGRMLRGAVTGGDGQPVVGAVVTVRGAAGQTTLADGSGEFLLELPDRAVDLQVALPDRSRPVTVPVPVGLQQVAVRLDTPSTCTLAASVAGLPGKQRLSGVLLRATRLDDDDIGVDTRSRWVELQNGRLQWPLCPVGRVRLEVWSDGFAPFVVEREFAASETCDLGEVLLEPGAWLAGLVQAEDGQPVANATVWLGEEEDADLFEPDVRTGADGSFRIGGVTAASSRLVVRATGFAPRTVELALPQDVLSPRPLLVRLERGATIELQFGRRGEREGVLVQLRQRGRVVASTDVDEAGRAWFPNRSAGTYQVVAPGVDLPAREVVVAPGETVVRVRLAD